MRCATAFTPLLFAIALPITAQAQEDDRSYLTALLEDNLSGAGRQVIITGFAGALSSKATIQSLTIADDAGVWLTLTDVALDWNRAALFTGRVSVNALTAGEIVLDRLPVAGSNAPSPEAGGFALPDLPVSVQIGTLAATRIVLGETVLGTPLEGRLEASASLEGGEGATSLVLERTDDGPEGRVALEAAYANDSGQLVLDLEVIEGVGGIAATLLDLPGAPSVDLTVKGSGPITDYTADIRLATDGVERLGGQVTLFSDATGNRFAASLGGDLAPLFLPEYAEFFGPEVALIAEGQRAPTGRMDLSHLSIRTRALDLTGAAVIAADGLPEKINLQGKMELDGTPVLLPLGGGPRTTVDHADISLTFDALRDNAWRLVAGLRGLNRPDLAAQSVQIVGSGRIDRSPGGTGKATVGGTLNLTATGLAPTDAGLAQALGTAVGSQLTFVWQEGTDGLSIPRFTLTGEDYGLTGGARIEGLETGLTVTGQAEARLENLGRASLLAGRPLSGGATAQLKGQGALLAGSFDVAGTVQGTDLTFDQPELDRLLTGTSAIKLSVRRDETGTLLRQLDVVAQNLTAKASGQVSSTGSDVVADLSFADLSVLGPQWAGSLVGRAQLTGTPEAGTITLKANGNGLALGVAEVDRLLRGPSTLDVEADFKGTTLDLRKLDLRAATLSAGVTGKIAAKGNDLRAILAFSDLSAMGGGYRGALNATASFTGTSDDGALTLQGAGQNLAIGQAEADTLLRGTSRIDANLSLAGGQVKINSANLSNPQLGVQATGAIAGNKRQVDLTARLANLGLILPDFPGQVTVTGKAVEDPTGYTLDLRGTGPGQIDATVTGRLAPNFASGTLAMRGSAQAGLANAFLSPRTVTGPLRFDLALNGPLALRSLSGSVSMAGGEIADPDLPFALNAVNANATLSGGQMRVEASSAVSTGGNVRVTGSMGLEAPFNADLTAALQQVIARDPQLYEVRMNGTVTINGALMGGAVIGGDVLLNETELLVPSTGFGGAGGLEPLFHLAEPADVRATRARAGLLDLDGNGVGGISTRRPYPLALRVSAPNRLFIRGRGLDAELGGEVFLGGTTANIVPSGAFNLVRGRLDILGKRLDLTEALMQLEGDLVPFLRILASTEVDGITASVQIEGPATEPKVSFVSSPELPEEEVLARLLFGRDLTSLSPFQAAQLAAAVATLAGKGGDGVIGKLRKGFGLDDLDVITDSDGGTSLKAGKYISKNTYTEVIVDQGGGTQINLNIDLTDTITLRGSAGADGETGIGIFMEKDY